MGDRRMAEIKTGDGSLYIYTHWEGEALPDVAKAAVAKAKPRWDDKPYAVRIMVDQLISQYRDQETGSGIMLKPDAEDQYNDDKPSVIIDLPGRTLTSIKGGSIHTLGFEELKMEAEQA